MDNSFDSQENEPCTSSVRRSSRPKKPTNKYEESKRQLRTRKTTVESDEDDDKDFSGEEFVIQDTVSSNIAGAEIYSFDKVRKHDRIFNTPVKGKESLPELDVTKTPHNLRKHIKKAIKSLTELDLSDEEPFIDSGSEYSGSQKSESTDESSDDDKSENSETSDDEEEAASKPKAPKKVNAPIAPQKRTTRKPNKKYVIKTEEYFTNNAQKKATTSNHTLDELETPRLNQEQLRKLLSKVTVSKEHNKAMEGLQESARSHFNKWLLLLQEDFNLLFFGLGSKKSILDQFHKEMLTDHPVLVVNGFFPSLTLKEILDTITQDLLEINEHSGNVFEVCDRIIKEFEEMPDQHFYLIIHNIDGSMLRNNKCQSVLANLAAAKNIHLIASIDHINAPLIWDHYKLSKFNFIWYDITTYLSYIDETSFETSMMVQQTGNLALSSLRNVFLSLTTNSKGIYKTMMKYQLENNINQYYQGMLFKDLYWKCREQFLVSSDLALKTQLTEFIDHKMVKLRRSGDGGEYLIIPIANNLLQQFLNEQG